MAGALKGLKILDFSTLLPGPYATMCMADMGADVLRVVSGSRPDLIDFFPPIIPGTKLSAASAYLGRNKKIMTMNLKDERAVKIVHQLVNEYDIVLEQFRPGVMDKFGLGYEELKKINPRLIYCSLTGYGQTGPMRDRAGHDMNYIAVSGVASYSGKKETGPALIGMQIADVASGSNNAIIGILSAVIHRQNTGQGQYLDVSMTDGVIAFNAMAGAGFLVDGQEPGREELLTNGGSLLDYYQTKEGRYLVFGGAEPQFYRSFFQTIGKPEWIAGGTEPPNLAEVKEELRELIKTKTLDDWMILFKDVDACVDPVLTLSEALSSQLVQEREMVVEVLAPDGNMIKQVAQPIKFSKSKPEYQHVGIPAAQANTKEIVARLGYSAADIELFAQAGVFS